MRVACYERVSTEEQSLHGLSIEAQKAALSEWAKGQLLVDHYTDLGVSARKPIMKRPELQRLLRDVEAGLIDVVVFTRLDRWTRSIREYYKAQDILDLHNVAWRAIQEDYETETASGRLKVNVMLAVAQDEADRTSERIKAVFDDKRRKGLLPTGAVPFGLCYRDGRVYPGPDAEKVPAIFDEYINTRTVSAVTSATKEILGKQYSPRGIMKLLSNELYLTTGVVDRATWETVQEIKQARATRCVRSDRVYLFSGILICPECGYRLVLHTTSCKSGIYVYYRCDRNRRGNRCGWGKSVSENALEEYLKSHILKAVEEYNLEIGKRKKKPVNVKTLQTKLDKLTDLYLEDLITREDYDMRSSPIRDEIKAAQASHREVSKTEVLSAMEAYETLSRPAKKAFWSRLVKRITPTEGGFDIEIF